MSSYRREDDDAGVCNPTLEAKVSHTRLMVGVSGFLVDGLGESTDACLTCTEREGV